MKEVLLVEDDFVDAQTVRRAVKDLGLSYNIKHVTNGQEAIDYLASDDVQYPHFILLDINMPIMNGIEFLEARKNVKNAIMIPVIVLTTSQYETDRLRCFESSIAGYMVKPVDYQDFIGVVKAIDEYWSLSEYPQMDLLRVTK